MNFTFNFYKTNRGMNNQLNKAEKVKKERLKKDVQKEHSISLQPV